MAAPHVHQEQYDAECPESELDVAATRLTPSMLPHFFPLDSTQHAGCALSWSRFNCSSLVFWAPGGFHFFSEDRSLQRKKEGYERDKSLSKDRGNAGKSGHPKKCHPNN